jgi:hypothetical protein
MYLWKKEVRENRFAVEMKEMVIGSMQTYFGRITGFTQEMQQVVIRMFREGDFEF